MPRTEPLNDEQIDHVLTGLAEGFATQDATRAPVLHTPAEQGLAYQDVTFPALDGVPLEGWFVPAPGSDRLVIANHAMGFSRSGQPTHLEPWVHDWGTVADGANAVEVDFVPDLKVLHDAGYNVLTYDLRNHGLSGAGNGGVSSSGWFEARDVIGSLRFAGTDPRMRGMATGLFSRCLGCNATFAAMAQFPEEFRGVRCLVGAQPVTTKLIVRHQLALAGVPDARLDSAIDDLDGRIRLTTSLGFAARDNRQWARHVTVPTLLYGVHDDVLTDHSDLEIMLENIPAAEKDLYWIHDSVARWDGYLEFQRHPERSLGWLREHLGRR